MQTSKDYEEIWSVLNVIQCICIGIILTISVIMLLDLTPETGYKQAYEDMQQGTIEQTVQKKYPDLWIKYNTNGGPKFPKEKE